MLKGTRFVRQLMELLLFLDLRHQNVRKRGQKFVMKSPRHQMKTQIRMGMRLVMVIVMAMGMGMGMGMEKMGRAETETMEGILTMGTEEHLMVADHSLIDVNDRENFLLDIIAVDYL
jgi:hypothetical protein